MSAVKQGHCKQKRQQLEQARRQPKTPARARTLAAARTLTAAETPAAERTPAAVTSPAEAGASEIAGRPMLSFNKIRFK